MQNLSIIPSNNPSNSQNPSRKSSKNASKKEAVSSAISSNMEYTLHNPSSFQIARKNKRHLSVKEKEITRRNKQAKNTILMKKNLELTPEQEELLTDFLDLEIKNKNQNISENIKKVVQIARVMAEKPPIVVFEDSAIETKHMTVKEMFNILELFLLDSTIICINNDIRQILNFNRVLFLDKGSLVEEGQPH